MTKQLDPNAIIITDRLLLRPLLPADGDAIYALRSNPDVVAMCLSHHKPQRRDEFIDFLKYRMEDDSCVSHCVELRDSSSQHESQQKDPKGHTSTQKKANKPDSILTKQGEKQIIGLVGAHRIPEIGYMFFPAFWGHGFATEALKAWMRWYWDKYPGGDHLKAVTGPETVTSQKVLRKCGFVWSFESSVQVDIGGVEGADGKRYTRVDTWKVERP